MAGPVSRKQVAIVTPRMGIAALDAGFCRYVQFEAARWDKRFYESAEAWGWAAAESEPSLTMKCAVSSD
jgi:hypothetical protein